VEWILSRPIAHRGLHDDLVDENSLSAFKKAVDHNFPIELDVHLTNDGNLIVFHDDNFERMTGFYGNVCEANDCDLLKLRLKYSKERIPYLEDVLDLVDGKVPLLIEIKNRKNVIGPTECTLARALSKYDGECAIQSFNPYTLEWFKKNAPSVIRGQLSGDFRGESLAWHSKFLLKNLLLCGLSRPSFIAYDSRCIPSFPIVIAQRCGIPIIAWTVKSHDEEDKVKSYCKNIIFEGYTPQKNSGDWL
jgi:glycerophosphoryl diester phosphodiesterase